MISSPPQAPEDFGTDVPSLYDDYNATEMPQDRGFWSYAKRPTGYGNQRGWVVQVPYQENLRTQYERRGFVYLLDYGQFLITQRDADPRHNDHKDSRGVVWNSALEPWRQLFIKGGAKEFPIDQVVTYHWHLVPPYREVKFPQLEVVLAAGKQIYDYQCPECYEKPMVFSSLNQRQAALYLRTHLTSRVNEQHSYTPQDLKELGDELGISLMSARIAMPRALVRTLAPELEEEAPAPEMEEADLTEAMNLAYRCEVCGWAPTVTNKNPANALRFHKRRHERE